MEQKIAELTKKIFDEGVAKGEEQKKAIVSAAEQDAARIKADAKKEAEKMIAAATKQAEEMKRNAESEIKLSSQQAISSLKQKITDMLLVKSVDGPVSGGLEEPGLIKEMVSTIVSHWQASGNQVPALEILLPENSKAKLEKALEDSLKKTLKNGVTVSFSKNIKGGFQIGPKAGSYKISLTDEDFIEFFKEYLRPKTRSLLFKE